MTRSRSLVARLTALCTALVTVWCLGCSAYGSLFVVFGGEGMPCATRGEMAGMQQSSASTSATDAGTRSVRAAAVETAGDIGCGCQSCTAATPSAQLVTVAASVLPLSLVASPTSLSHAAPEPLLPPPQVAS
ncbi:MAG: hypothetical protein V4550_18745 [Gemmatimonadota bacterium]